jgi:hypothetical protein
MIEINDSDILEAESILKVDFDSIRRQAIKNFDDIQAYPGSGKTTMVAAKLIILAKKWSRPYQGICVLTHTNVAKNEIIERLRQSPDGETLLSYPHFIGTIQEFVNKFLAIPYLRSIGGQVNTVDDEICTSKGWHYLKYATKGFLARKHITSLYGMEYKFENDILELKVPGFSKKSSSDSYMDLVSVKKKLMNDGYFYYCDMYAFARKYLLHNTEVKNAVRSRFPIVLIDEMQDTQKFQDELLNEMFSTESVRFQRFGDPDQAIYSSDGEENQTYNKTHLNKIESSHRFDDSIALLAKKLSFNKINLHSTCMDLPEKSTHTIFLVNDATRCKVVNEFIILCAKVIPEQNTKPIKVVGAVGIRKEDGLTIRSYVASYDKDHSSNTYKPQKLIHYFYESRRFESIYQAYRMILEGIVKLGQISNSELIFSDGSKRRYSDSNIRSYLKDIDQQVKFNTIVKSLMTAKIEIEVWNEKIIELKSCLNLNVPVHLLDFVSFEDVHASDENNNESPNKLTTEINGRNFEIEVATIHSVKGETHAATLVLETKNHEFDVGGLMEYILGDNDVKPTGVRKQKFMKQLYVAFSRPRYLLCVAVDISRFPEKHINRNEYAGWNIVDLTSESN